jgi:hypothetical protein
MQQQQNTQGVKSAATFVHMELGVKSVGTCPAAALKMKWPFQVYFGLEFGVRT